MNLLVVSVSPYAYSAKSLEKNIEGAHDAASAREPRTWQQAQIKFLLNTLHSLAQLQKRDESCIGTVQPLLALAARDGALSVRQHFGRKTRTYQGFTKRSVCVVSICSFFLKGCCISCKQAAKICVYPFYPSAGKRKCCPFLQYVPT